MADRKCVNKNCLIVRIIKDIYSVIRLKTTYVSIIWNISATEIEKIDVLLYMIKISG